MILKLILSLDVILIFILIYNFRFIKPLVLVLMFVLLLLTPLINFYLTGAIISKHLSFNEVKYYNKLLVIISTFIFALSFTLNYLRQKLSKAQVFFPKFRVNDLQFFLICIFLFLIINYGTNGDNILESEGNYGKDGFISSYFEYGILLLFLMLSTIGESKVRLIALFILTSLYLYYSVLFGSRITILSIMILYFVRYESRINYLFVMLIAPFIFVLFNIVALFRTYLFDFNLTDALSFSIIDSNVDVQSNHQSDVLHSCVRLIGMIDQGVISTQDRIISGLSNLAAIFVPFKYLPDIANLSMYKADEFDLGGGGFFPVYFYIWLGYFGIIISVLVICLFLKLYFSPKLYFQSLGIVFFLTSPRWIMYSPINLFKMCFIFTILYFLLKSTYHITRKKF